MKKKKSIFDEVLWNEFGSYGNDGFKTEEMQTQKSNKKEQHQHIEMVFIFLSGDVKT